MKSYTFGMGDRFAHQGHAQLQAVLSAQAEGIDVYPAWNKSFREHTTVKTNPDGLRAEADDAVTSLGWKGEYYVDADHIGLNTVDGFLAGSNFYTLDVAEFVGKPPSDSDVEEFLAKNRLYLGEISIEGLSEPITITEEHQRKVADTFLSAIKAAGEIYRYIEEKKGKGTFVTEVSIDETDHPQSPVDLFLILSMIAAEGIPAETIAPKFTGRFNKGVDYVGDLGQFEKEFEEDLAVISYAVKEFGLPEGLKLSVHSGSDKFSLYPIINQLIKKYGAGLHVKTAGTTWLEEVIGLAESGGEALQIAKEIYTASLSRYDELTGPYATVIDIDLNRLPTPEEVEGWDAETFAHTLRHDQSHPLYNPHFRQLIHVGYKVAAELGDRFTGALKTHEATIAKNVTENLLSRHILPLFR